MYGQLVIFRDCLRCGLMEKFLNLMFYQGSYRRDKAGNCINKFLEKQIYQHHSLKFHYECSCVLGRYVYSIDRGKGGVVRLPSRNLRLMMQSSNVSGFEQNYKQATSLIPVVLPASCSSWVFKKKKNLLCIVASRRPRRRVVVGAFYKEKNYSSYCTRGRIPV